MRGRRPWPVLLLFASALAAAGGAAAEAPPEPPDPDLGGVEAPVRAVLEQRRAAVLEAPTSADAWGRLGMALDIHDFEADAERAYGRAAALAPDHFPWVYYRALTLADLADPRAPAAFEHALGQNPGFSPLHVRYADLLLDGGDVDAAEGHYRRAIEADGDGLAHALFGLARVAVLRGALEPATDYAEQASTADPGHRGALGLLAELYRRRGMDRRAAEARRAHAEIRGPAVLVDAHVAALMEEGVSSYWHHERGQFFLASRRPERAEAEFRRALELSPHALFFESLARSLVVQGRLPEAEDAVKSALGRTPDLASSHLLLGRLLIRADRRREATESLRRAAELRPDSPAARELGKELVASGERDEGIRWLERSLRNDEEPRILLSVAFYYATTPNPGRRDAEKAERLARRLLEISGDRPEAFDTLAASLAAQGRFDEAIDAGRRALELASGRGSPLVLQMRQRLELYRSGRAFVTSR
ncbi:MAG: tetratricopeptide repeat protein [Acidobacteriota bacterium]